LVVGSSGLTDSVDNLLEIEKNGAGAVVLKSLFEEEILNEMKNQLSAMSSAGFIYPETMEFYDYYEGPKESTTSYIDLIEKAKEKLTLPVIASINCMDAQNWTYFPKQLEKAGADAIELNIFNLPSDLNKSAAENEKVYFDIIHEVQQQISIPLFVKLSYYSSNLASFLISLAKTGIDGMILFNRFYNPDIDIDTLEITSGAILSNPNDVYQSLRWIAILSDRLDCSLIASTGIHDSAGVIKQILAGASAVQIVSALYKNGLPYIKQILNGIETWMQQKKYTSLDNFRGKLSQSHASNPAVYSRVQFMKYYRGFSYKT
jgi:dihydroorotate dehydrogenase (fumarate)